MLHSINGRELNVNFNSAQKARIDPKATGRNLKAYREDRFKLTQEELADLLVMNGYEVSIQSLSKWENGWKHPNLDALEAIAFLYGCTVLDLIVTYGQSRDGGDAA